MLTDARVVEPYERSTLHHEHRVPAVLRPGSTHEVQQVVRVAAEHGVALYPISRGQNWGYGSRAPASDGAVVLDLGRMDRIIAYDAELAYVTVEPGVTQQQLVDFLAEHGARHWADTTSVTPRASVVGNILERGHGLTPYADHVECLGGLEVVLGDGRLLCTGHGRFGESDVEGLDRLGAGPSLTGLFTQSSYGVVTKATVWLMPAPEAVRAVVMDLESDEELFRILPLLRELRLRRTIESGPRFANVYRGLMFEEYPWDLVPPGSTLAKDEALRLARERGRGAWRVCFAVYGSSAEVAARLRTVDDALRGLSAHRPVVFDPMDAESGEGSARRYRVLASLLTGRLLPGGAASMRAYWRKPSRPQGPPDPDRDRCGVVWLAPVTPFRASDVATVQHLVEDVLPRHGFEPDISMYCLRPRVLHYHISIIYDRDKPGDDAAAKAAHEELLGRFLAAGYPPHRLGIQSMFAMNHSSDVHKSVLGGVKKLLDPALVLSPRRYTPSDA